MAFRIFTVGDRAFCTQGAAQRFQEGLDKEAFRMIVPHDLLLLDPEERVAVGEIIKTLNELQGEEA